MKKNNQNIEPVGRIWHQVVGATLLSKRQVLEVLFFIFMLHVLIADRVLHWYGRKFQSSGKRLVYEHNMIQDASIKWKLYTKNGHLSVWMLRDEPQLKSVLHKISWMSWTTDDQVAWSVTILKWDLRAATRRTLWKDGSAKEKTLRNVAIKYILQNIIPYDFSAMQSGISTSVASMIG